MADFPYEKIILASGSARRREIFERHGHAPVIEPMDVDETLPEGIAPHDAVMYLALKKGLAAEAAHLSGPTAGAGEERDTEGFDAAPDARSEKALIVSADTIVYARDIATGEWAIMGKPHSEDDAWRMLKSIRGTSHKVMTGVALIALGTDSEEISDPDAEPRLRRVFYDTTDVYVNDISDEELQEYINSGEPYGKAGGYAIQLGFGKYIDHIEGDYENVVGFPYEHMLHELDDALSLR